jgi:hypothetical protein
LDIRTNQKGYVQIPNHTESRSTPESDLHIVSDKPLDNARIKLLRDEYNFKLYEIDSTIIATKAVTSIRFDSQSRKEGYDLFQKCLLDPQLFGSDNEFKGYMEFESRNLELTGKKIVVPWSPYNNPDNLDLDLPFLNPQPVIASNFKKGDLHLSVVRVDSRLEKILLDKGFYYADFENRENNKREENGVKKGLHRILTIQSSEIRDTLAIKKKLIEFVKQVGGVSGTIVDEPTLAYVRTKQNSVPPCSNVRIR